MLPNNSMQRTALRAAADAGRYADHAASSEGPTLHVRSFAPDEWRVYRELRLGALREAPDAFGSTLLREADCSDSEWEQRLARGVTAPGELPLLAEVDGKPTGLAWARLEGQSPPIAHLYQVWVTPAQRARGCGRALVEAALAWAESAGAVAVRLNVTCGDSPATRLYERLGFHAVGEPKPLRPGSSLLSQPMERRLLP